jgi:DNA-binding beta-propeller fold protein YncE
MTGIMTVVDNRACTVSQFSQNGKLLREIGGQGWGNDQFDRPAGVWAKNGIDVFVADYGNHRIQRFDNALAYVSTLSTRDNSDPDKRFGYPTAVTLSRLGELFICDGENSRIAKVGSSNQVDLTFGGYGAGAGRLNRPLQIDCGPNDDLYVLDPPRIVMFDAFGNYLGDLAAGAIAHPLALCATQNAVIVIDSVSVFFFDAQQHLSAQVPLPERARAIGISSCATTASAVYLIGEGGLEIVPRTDNLDKDRISR